MIRGPGKRLTKLSSSELDSRKDMSGTREHLTGKGQGSKNHPAVLFTKAVNKNTMEGGR